MQHQQGGRKVAREARHHLLQGIDSPGRESYDNDFVPSHTITRVNAVAGPPTAKPAWLLANVNS